MKDKIKIDKKIVSTMLMISNKHWGKEVLHRFGSQKVNRMENTMPSSRYPYIHLIVNKLSNKRIT